MVEVRKAKPEEAPVLLELIRALAEYEKLDPPAEAAQGRLVRDIFGDVRAWRLGLPSWTEQPLATR